MAEIDTLGRPLVADPIRAAITDAFKGVNGRGALVILADGSGARAVIAAKYGDHWKVAAGVGTPWHGPVSAAVAIEAVW